MAIRYDKKLNTEINKTIRNFNAKVRRLEKSNKKVLIPQKINKKTLLNEVENKRELKSKLNEIKMFSKRGIEQIEDSGISKYEIEIIKVQKKRVSDRLKRQINKFSKTIVEVGGREQDVTLAQMGDEYLSNLKARQKAINKRTSNLTKNEFLHLKDLLNRTEKNFTYKDTVFKENYLKMLLNEGYFYGYDEEKLKDIHDKIKSLSTREFLNLFYKDKAIQKILDFSLTDIAKNEKRAHYNPNYFHEAMEEIDDLYNTLFENIDTIVGKYKK